jgi:hypothetical protein
MLASLIVFSTCTQVEVIDFGDTENTGDENLILGKWEVSDKNATYGSFEFTSDKKYIVTQRVTELPGTKSITTRAEDNPVYIIVIFGDYTSLQQDGNTYTLDLQEFGTIIITIKDGEATITINGETYIGNKTEPIDISERTELLCHTWSAQQSKTIYKDGSFEYNDDGNIESITFTKDGTYVCKPSDDWINETGSEIEFGTWEWIKGGKIKIGGTVYYTTISDLNGEENRTTGSSFEYTDYDIINLTESELIFSQDIVDGDAIKLEMILHR